MMTALRTLAGPRVAAVLWLMCAAACGDRTPEPIPVRVRHRQCEQ